MKSDLAEKIVDGIIQDLSARAWFGDEWGTIAENTQKEIKAAWVDIVLAQSEHMEPRYSQEDILALVMVAGSIDIRFDEYREQGQPLDSGLHDWLKEAILPFRSEC
jgi:hypothetical protein